MTPENKLKYAILDLAHIWEHGTCIKESRRAFTDVVVYLP